MDPAAEPLLTPDREVAERVGVSLDAVQLVRATDVVDLHVEPFLASRLLGYDLGKRHERYWLGGRFFGHLDIPRALDGGLTGAMWSVVTNVARTARGRWKVTQRNVRELRAVLEGSGRIAVVRSASEYRAAREAGMHGALISLQGGNALEAAPDPAALSDVVRVTLLHLSNSCYGRTSSPARLLRRAPGLTQRGRELVERLDGARVFVDLAHIDERGFWDAVEVHDRELPLIVTHTGVKGVKDHWRNLDDAQIRAVAETGGVVGIMFEPQFLRARGAANDGRMVVAHLEHVIDVAGEDAAALGSDYDGFITPPPDLRDGFAGYFRLTQYMLEAGFREERIRKILGLSFLRSFERLRP